MEPKSDGKILIKKIANAKEKLLLGITPTERLICIFHIKKRHNNG